MTFPYGGRKWRRDNGHYNSILDKVREGGDKVGGAGAIRQTALHFSGFSPSGFHNDDARGTAPRTCKTFRPHASFRLIPRVDVSARPLLRLLVSVAPALLHSRASWFPHQGPSPPLPLPRIFPGTHHHERHFPSPPERAALHVHTGQVNAAPPWRVGTPLISNVHVTGPAS